MSTSSQTHQDTDTAHAHGGGQGAPVAPPHLRGRLTPHVRCVYADADEEEEEEAREEEEGDELEGEAGEKYLWDGERGRGKRQGGGRTWDPVRDLVRSLVVLPDIDIEPPAACRPKLGVSQETRRDVCDYYAHLDEKCGNVGTDEYARDEVRFYEKILVHVEVVREASEEDIVCCDERAGLVA
jgi:hypothetical protein